MTIVPTNKDLVGRVMLPMAGSGRVTSGQKVKIQFENFPHAEYGFLTGVVGHISAVPNEGIYLLDVDLADSLVTNYGKHLEFRQEMQGTAKIVTKDLRLAERFLFQIKQLLEPRMK